MTLTDIARRFFAGFDLSWPRATNELSASVELFRLGAGHPAPLCALVEALPLVTDVPLEHEHRFALDDAAGLVCLLADRPTHCARTTEPRGERTDECLTERSRQRAGAHSTPPPADASTGARRTDSQPLASR